MTQNYSMVSGDSRIFDFEVEDADGVAVSLAGALAATYAIAPSKAAVALVTKTLGAGIAIADNVVTVTLAPADTAGLAGVYYHEMTATDAAGQVFTIQDYITIAGDLIT